MPGAYGPDTPAASQFPHGPSVLGQVAPALDEVAQVQPHLAEDQFEALHHADGLRLDLFGQGRGRDGRHLPGEDQPSVALDRMGERRDGPGVACKKVQVGHGPGAVF